MSCRLGLSSPRVRRTGRGGRHPFQSPVDHLRGMKPEKVAAATLRAIERGRHEICLTAQGKLLVFVSRFFPRLADRIAARRVRQLFWDEVQANASCRLTFPENAKPQAAAQAANLTNQRVSQ